jgi:3-methylcrotonyl-CoA carboxylase alpha subunit
MPQPLDQAAAALGAAKLFALEAARIVSTSPPEPDAAPSPWDADDAFQLAGARALALPVVADGESAIARVSYGGGIPAVSVDGVAPATHALAVETADAVLVWHRGRQTKVTLRDIISLDAGYAGGGIVFAPMHGKVLAILVEQGARVAKGQRLAIIEAMKMEHSLTAPVAGVVAEIAVVQDGQVAEGAKIMRIEPAEPLRE